MEKEPLGFLTLGDVDYRDRTVLVRVDINVPLDLEGRRILDKRRIEAIKQTLDELEPARVVVISHQGRPEKKTYASLHLHYRELSRQHPGRVLFIEDVMGPAARNAIKNLRPGEILLLDNLRFCAEDLLEGSPAKMAQTYLVRRLAPLFDLFVNDAFGTAHRAHPSTVGFSYVLPSVAGRLMEREYRMLKHATSSASGRRLLILGGGKPETKIPMVKGALDRGLVDKVAIGGLPANVLLKAKGVDLGPRTTTIVDRVLHKHPGLLDIAIDILANYSDRVLLPIDVAVNEFGTGRRELQLEELPHAADILDIGEQTAGIFADAIREADIIIVNGPLGFYEHEEFRRGSQLVFEAVVNSNAFKLIGGADTIAAFNTFGLIDRVDYVSTGGGAMIAFLTGEPLPAIEALKAAARRMRGEELP